MPHQVDRGFLPRVAQEQVGKRHQSIALPYQRHRRAHQIGRIESAQRKALLAHVLVAQPGVGNVPQPRQQRRHRLGRHHLQPQALARKPVHRIAQHLAGFAIKVERRQPHARLLAHLQQGQPHLQVQVEIRRADLIEHRPSTGALALLHERPHQFAASLLVDTHRVAHRHPAAALDVVHHESLLLLVEQQRLVAHQGQVRLRRGGVLDQRQGPRKLGLARWLAMQANRPDQAAQRKQQAGRRRSHQCTQCARRPALVKAEFPPQVGAVVDVLVAEHHQPDGADEHRHDRRDPAQRKRGVEQRRPSIEQPMGRRERHRQQRQQGRLLVIDALEQRERGAGQQQNQGKHVRGIQAPLQAAGKNQQQHADHAGQQVRHLQHRQRQHLAQDRHAQRQRPRGAGKQQHRA